MVYFLLPIRLYCLIKMFSCVMVYHFSNLLGAVGKWLMLYFHTELPGLNPANNYRTITIILWRKLSHLMLSLHLVELYLKHMSAIIKSHFQIIRFSITQVGVLGYSVKWFNYYGLLILMLQSQLHNDQLSKSTKRTKF